MGLFFLILVGLGFVGIIGLIIKDTYEGILIHDDDLWDGRANEARKKGQRWPPGKNSPLYEDWQEYTGWVANQKALGLR